MSRSASWCGCWGRSGPRRFSLARVFTAVQAIKRLTGTRCRINSWCDVVYERRFVGMTRLLRPVIALFLGAGARAADAPLLTILDQLTAADVPERGPTEPGPTTRTWWDPTPAPSTQPTPIGSGLA